jgi:hypothetical protein
VVEFVTQQKHALEQVQHAQLTQSRLPNAGLRRESAMLLKIVMA